MRNRGSSFSGLPWKPTTLILTLLTILPLHTLAVEPAIQARGNVSLLLRNDGVLFQLGGQSFTPVTLPDTAIPPIQPQTAILTNVDSLPIPKGRHGDYGSHFIGEIALAIVSTQEVKQALFTWYPDGLDPSKAQPTPVSGLSEVKDIFLGAPCSSCSSYFVVTNTGTVFSFDGRNNNAMQLSGLSDVKLITADSSRYVALTNAGTVYYGPWNSSDRQYEPAIPIANLTNVTDIKYLNNVSYALADGKVYGWTWVLDPMTETYIPTTVTPITDAAGNELSSVKELRWKDQTLAVTQAGTVLWWRWNEDNKVPTVALPITDLPNITEIFGKSSAYLARSLTGELYYWIWNQSSKSPTRASQIILPSTVKTLFISKGSSRDFAILNNGELYYWIWNQSSKVPTKASQIILPSTVKTLFIPKGSSRDFTTLNNGEVYSWDWYSSSNPTTPTQIQGLYNPKKIHHYSSHYHFLVLTESKEVYNLVSGNITLAQGLANVKVIATWREYPCNNYPYYRCRHYLALKEDGTLCGGGDNSSGQVSINAPNTISEDEPLCGIEDLIVEPSTAFTSLTVNKTGTGEGTVTADTGAIHCGTSCNANYPQKQTVTLRAKPQVGSIFTGWGSGCTNTDPVTKVTLTDAVTCTATFDKVPLHKLTVTKAGNGKGMVTSEPTPISGESLNCGSSTCTVDYLKEQTVTLRAKPQVGYTFIAWSGGCTGTMSVTTVTLSDAVTCTATFDKAPHRKLTVTKVGNGTVTSRPTPVNGESLNCESSTCTVDYLNLTEVTLTATPDATSEDIAEINCSGKSIDDWGNNRKFILTEDRECTVTFQLLANYPLNVVVNSEDGSSGKVVSEPAGIDCGSDCTEDFLSGTTITLTPIPNLGSIVKRWYCNNESSSYYVTIKGKALECSITFGLPPIPPKIEVNPPSHKFGFKGTGVDNRLTQSFSISNIRETVNTREMTDLRINSIAVKGASDFRVLEDNCSNTSQAFNESCQISVAYEPHTDATQTATLWIFSNDPDTPMTIPFCAGAYSPTTTQEPKVYPSDLNFGAEVVGNNSITLTQWIKTWTDGCGALIDQNKFTLEGKDAADFNISSKECYYAAWDDKTDNPNKTTYSTCQVNVTFLPVTPGEKHAQLKYALNDPSLSADSVPLTGTAVAAGSAQPKLEVFSSSTDFGEVPLNSLDFGEVILYRSSLQNTFTIKNTGNVNLIPSMKLTAPDEAAFSVIGGECTSQQVFFSGESCNFSAQFAPQGTLGNQQASLIIAPEKPYATTVALTGTSIEATDCAEANITIESSGTGDYWDSDVAWTRLQNPTGSEPNHPTENDVVRIKNGHTLFGPVSSTTVVKTLCIENGATLQSLDDQGTSLEIRATDFIGNWGAIIGQDGANEDEMNPCTKKAAVGTGSCAKPGASVILKVGTKIQSRDKQGAQWWESYDSGGPIVNKGSIMAGNGGNGLQYAAAGGNAIVLGRNTLNKGFIKAGDGGYSLGTIEGESGAGGLTQVWGKLGGKGYLRSETDTQIFAGNGGHCNSSATEPQTGGKGGNLWLVSLPDVYLDGGTHKAGKSSSTCTESGGDGELIIEPNVISLAGANTKMEGGDIFIYGGPNWILDLSNLTHSAVTATGNITLAVDKGGVIDLRGSIGKLFNAVGQVSIFADNILLDENQKLSDLIDASQIVIGPPKVLYDVALTGATQVVGGPNSTTFLTLTLANGSPNNDTFLLEVTDSGGWISNQLPETLEVAGLEMVDLTLKVKLPAEIGMTDIITVTATSQADPTVTAMLNIQVNVVDLASLVPSPPTVPLFTTDPVPVHSECPTTGVIDSFCSNHDQIIQDATLTSAASITGGTLAGTLTSQGYVSSVTIQAGTTLTGGKLTGHIINEGTLVDFEFVGAVIEGGTLAGTITNRSYSSGVIKNVNLAANTTISWVNLQGNIVGDNSAPALLEHVTIKSNSFLSGVKLGEGVIVEDNVTCGEGVQAPEGVCSPNETEPLPQPKLPDLGAIAINKQGESVPTSANFYGGIAVNNGPFESQMMLTLADEATIQGQIQVDPAHVGQAAEVVVYVDYTPVGTNELVYAMLNEEGKPVKWDNKPAQLVPFKIIPKLAESIEVLIYQDKLPVTGVLNIEFGYRLADGLIVHNLKPIEVNVNP